uniref:Uncharacterized protein n=2 Tax=Cryptomonas curvata TaxID=233186 RepID=A0A7S0MEE3_9CRYP
MTGWLQVGTVLGVAVDLEQGCMLATACPTSISSVSDWHTVFKTGLSPSSEIGSALFPVISGVLGAEVKYNFGNDPASRPMLHSPPSDDYKPISAALFLNGGQAAASADSGGLQMLHSLNISSEKLLQSLNEVLQSHGALDDESFNDDQIYKERLNEVLDMKVCLTRKQEDVVMLLADGGSAEQLQVCGDAPPRDFLARLLIGQECSYTWRQVLSGLFKYRTFTVIPLGCAPCQIALVWGAVLDSEEAIKTVSLGDDRVLEVSELLPNLQIKQSGLHFLKFEHAVLGLLLASNLFLKAQSAAAVPPTSAPQPCDPACLPAESGHAPQGCLKAVPGVTSVDLRSCEFSSERVAQLHNSVVAGCYAGFILSFNGLIVEHKEDLPFHKCVKRDGKEEVLSRLDKMDWDFVMARAAVYLWRTLDLSPDAISTIPSSRRKLDSSTVGFYIGGLATVVSLTSLSLRMGNMGVEGSRYVAECLPSLSSLSILDLGSNCLEGCGCTTIATALLPLTGLCDLLLDQNNMGSDGAAAISMILPSLSMLRKLHIQSNNIKAAGGTSIALALPFLTNLTELEISHPTAAMHCWTKAGWPWLQC